MRRWVMAAVACGQGLVEDVEVVEPAASVAFGAAEEDDLDAEGAADPARAAFPRAGREDLP